VFVRMGRIRIAMGLNSSIEGEGCGFGAGERGAEHVSTVNPLSAAARVEWSQ
jgi:hypothetical protein